jgi:hypothetical protein
MGDRLGTPGVVFILFFFYAKNIDSIAPKILLNIFLGPFFILFPTG